jgi:hypothetical protein
MLRIIVNVMPFGLSGGLNCAGDKNTDISEERMGM